MLIAYQDSCADGHAPAAVRVRHDVTVADRQERYRYHPHRVQEIETAPQTHIRIENISS